MAIWTMNACIQKDICHDLYGEVTTWGKLRCEATVLRMVVADLVTQFK